MTARKKNREKTGEVPVGPPAGVEKVQRQIARYLDRKVNLLSIPARKIGLIIFGMVMGGASLWSITSSFMEDRKVNLFIDRISLPENIYRKEQAMSSWSEFEHARLLKQYLEALQYDDKGKALYDSIMMQYPGLLDSMSRLVKPP